MSGSEPLKACCPDLEAAAQSGTEMYGPAVRQPFGEWLIGVDLPPPRYCPWCGAGINGNRRAPSPVVAEVVKEMRAAAHVSRAAGRPIVLKGTLEAQNVERWADRLERGE